MFTRFFDKQQQNQNIIKSQKFQIQNSQDESDNYDKFKIRRQEYNDNKENRSNFNRSPIQEQGNNSAIKFKVSPRYINTPSTKQNCNSPLQKNFHSTQNLFKPVHLINTGEYLKAKDPFASYYRKFKKYQEKSTNNSQMSDKENISNNKLNNSNNLNQPNEKNNLLSKENKMNNINLNQSNLIEKQFVVKQNHNQMNKTQSYKQFKDIGQNITQENPFNLSKNQDKETTPVKLSNKQNPKQITPNIIKEFDQGYVKQTLKEFINSKQTAQTPNQIQNKQKSPFSIKTQMNISKNQGNIQNNFISQEIKPKTNYQEFSPIQTQKTPKNSVKLQTQISQRTISPLIKKASLQKTKVPIGPLAFKVIGQIGKGSFGHVYLVEQVDSKIQYAMKILDKQRLITNNLLKYAITEKTVLSVCDHPNINKLHYSFQTPQKLYLILDYCSGGDLSEHLQQQVKFSEKLTKSYIVQIILALEQLHKKNIIYRDLKPENIVLDKQGFAILTDFGLSKLDVKRNSDGATSFCGSIAYLAPEMLKKQGHGKAIDWYLLGVVMFEMLTGLPPFYESKREKIFENIQNKELVVPKFISQNCSQLIYELMKKDPSKRLGSGPLGAQEIKNHPFFKDICWDKVFLRQFMPQQIGNRPMIQSSKNQQIYDSLFTSSCGDENYVPNWDFNLDK